MDDGESDPNRLTVGDWLGLRGKDREGAGLVLAARARLAVRRIPRWAMDGEDAAQEVAIRALAEDCAALRRVRDLGTPLLAWLRGCAWNLLRKKKKKVGNGIDVEGVIDPRPGPEEVMSHDEDERLDEGILLMALADLSSPRGLVLYLQACRGLSHAEIHEELSRLRPVGRDRVDQLIREAHAEFRAWLAGKVPRQLWPRRFSPKRDPWFATPLPPPESPDR